MIEKPPLRLERFATLRAEIDAGAAVDAVIDREEITSETWMSAQLFWQKRMADEAERKRSETTSRYQTLYRTKKRIFEKRRDRATEAVDPAVREEARPPGTLPSPPVSVATPFVPSAPAPIAPVPIAPLPIAPVPIAPLPIAPLPVAPPRIAPPPRQQASPRTMAMDINQLFAQTNATPFQKAPSADHAPQRPSDTVPPESARAALPFRQVAPAPDAATNKMFSINQFASLTAEIAESPHDVAEIRKRYRITEAQHREESQRWTDEFTANSGLRERYFGIVHRYREYLKKPPT